MRVSPPTWLTFAEHAASEANIGAMFSVMWTSGVGCTVLGFFADG